MVCLYTVIAAVDYDIITDFLHLFPEWRIQNIFFQTTIEFIVVSALVLVRQIPQ